jgi:hypothetical protein
MEPVSVTAPSITMVLACVIRASASVRTANAAQSSSGEKQTEIAASEITDETGNAGESERGPARKR